MKSLHLKQIDASIHVSGVLLRLTGGKNAYASIFHRMAGGWVAAKHLPLSVYPLRSPPMTISFFCFLGWWGEVKNQNNETVVQAVSTLFCWNAQTPKSKWTKPKKP